MDTLRGRFGFPARFPLKGNAIKSKKLTRKFLGIIVKYFEASCWDIQNWKSCWAFILIPLSVIFESKHPFLVVTRFLFTRLCVLCLRRSLFHHRAVIFLFQVLLRKAINIFQTLNISFNPFVFNCRTEQKGIYRAQRILLQFHWKLSTLHNGSK